MKRVILASFHHESNTFNPIITGPDDFSVLRGDEIYDHLNDRDSISGIIHRLKQEKLELIPLIFARAVPNGPVSLPFYQSLKQEFMERLDKAVDLRPIDGAVLALHGSMTIEELGDAEGDLLTALHERLPGLPVFAALDMHTSYTDAMHDRACYVGYKCAPHTDCFETGVHGADMAIKYFKGGKEPVHSRISLPLLFTGEMSETNTEPMKSIMAEFRRAEETEGVWAASLLMGFPWADNPDNTLTVLVEGQDESVCREEAERLAALVLSRKEEFVFHTETYPPAEALETALDGAESGPVPVYLSDSGDNPTAGSSGDVTDFLDLILKSDRVKRLEKPLLYGGIYDPEATEACRGRTGETVTLTLGAKFDKKTSRPLTLTGRVSSFVEQWGTYQSDMALFTLGNVDIVLTAKHIGFTDPEQFRVLGAPPEERQVVVCKLGYLTDPHRRIAKRSIMALTKGSSNEDLTSLDYRNIRRPVFPLDPREPGAEQLPLCRSEA